MPRNGSGGYNLPDGNPVIAGTVITDVWANSTIADLTNEIANSMTIDGQTPLTGPLKFAAGTVTAPSITFNSEQNTGIYRPASQKLAITVNGQDQLVVGTTVTSTRSLAPMSANISNVGTSALRYNTMYATTFDGVASSARYADLAERFHADASYIAGTVVRIGGKYEITIENDDCSMSAFGVISTQPAFMMNSGAGDDDTHPFIALAGRVPIRVVGRVTKGDRLVSAGDGVARAVSLSDIWSGIDLSMCIIGRALEDKDTEEEGLLLSVVPRQ